MRVSEEEECEAARLGEWVGEKSSRSRAEKSRAEQSRAEQSVNNKDKAISYY
jgi:hypothetical protein